jgi:thiamine biosynthesis lipoprotein
VERVFISMGSPLRFSVYAESRAHGLRAISEGIREFTLAERLFSVYSPTSEISLLNRSAGRDMVPVSSATMELLQAAIRFQDITGGAFRACVEPLMRLWGFRNTPPARDRLPLDGEIREANAASRLDALILNTRESRAGLKYPGSCVDTCGIAVGFALDRCIRVLRSEGIEAACVNHSGDAYALGAPPEEAGWPVGIPDPSAGPDQLRRLTLKDMAISTSGNTVKHIHIGARTVGHLMDCSSGWPVRSCATLSVLAASALQADALSTGMFCIRDAAWRKNIMNAEGVECYWQGEECR